jgi:hypothetical protein
MRRIEVLEPRTVCKLRLLDGLRVPLAVVRLALCMLLAGTFSRGAQSLPAIVCRP